VLESAACRLLKACLGEQPSSSIEEYTLLNLHFLVVSILALYVPPFPQETFSEFWTMLKSVKKDETINPQRSKVVDVLRRFYKPFEDPSSCKGEPVVPDWNKMNWDGKNHTKRREEFKFKTFWQHLLKMYSLVVEVSGHLNPGQCLLCCQEKQLSVCCQL
jgi:hypothetical protein